MDGVQAAELAQKRLRLILQTLSGEVSVQDACKELGVSRARFAELRQKALQAAVQGLEPGRPGRPRTEADPKDARIAELEGQVAELGEALDYARVRFELAMEMPEVLQRAEQKKGDTIDRAVHASLRRWRRLLAEESEGR